MTTSAFMKVSVAILLGCMAAVVYATPLQNRFGNGQLYRSERFQRLLQQRQGADRNRAVTLPTGAREVKNIAYGSNPKQRLDVYIPRDVRNAPIIFMVHGGGWRRGDKANYGVVQNKINYFLPKGFIFVSTNYRMVPEVGVMTESADVATALAYVQQHAATWGGDSSNLIVMGHSAGAQLVMMLTSVPEVSPRF